MSDPALVYVVDDDESVRTGTGSLLRSCGYNVETFDSAEAFLAFSGPDPACLICDVQMPGLSGPELFETLRRDGRTFATIFITAFRHDRLREMYGADTLVLGKPFEGAALLRAISEVTMQSS